MTWIDRFVAYLDPGRGLRRTMERARLRAYEAASPRDPWRPRRTGASANADHLADAAVLRHKARALVQNVPYIRAGMDALVAYTVGTGIVTRSLGQDAERFAAAYAEWVKVCDADGRLDWFGMQAAAYRAMEQDGEVLIRLRPRRQADGLPLPLQLQLLEVDWLDTSKSGALNNNEIVEGIEYDPLGRPVAYWMWDRHPGDVSMPRGARRESRRIPADSIIHLFNPERPGQGRGFTRLASVIARVRDLQLLEDAELARKNLETRLSVLASGDVSELADASTSPERARLSGELGELSSGGITQLPPGMSVTVVEPKAAPGHVEAVKHHLHIIAAGMGVTYEMLTGDLAGANFSSMRSGRMDMKRRVEAMQWQCLIPRLVDRVARAAMDAAFLAGIVRTADYRFDHSCPKWEYVNPEQDVKADMAEISMGLSTWSEKLRQRGYTPDVVMAEMKADVDRLRSTGVLDVLLALQGRTAPEVTAQAAARAQHEVHLHAPPVNVAAPQVSVAPADVRVEPTINVEPAAVTVTPPSVVVQPAEVRVEPAIHVAAPQVTVEQPLQIQPPEVRVDVGSPTVNVTLPRRRVDGTVERDERGRVLRTTQVETHLPDDA